MLRPIQIDATASCVSMFDPAIDKAASETVDDGATLTYTTLRLVQPTAWTHALKFHDAQRPTIFVMGVIPPGELARIEDECRLGKSDERTRELYWRCFLHGLRDIENGPTGDQKPDTIKRAGVEYVAPVWLERHFCGPLTHIAMEIGQNIFSWQQFRADEAKN